ncbi:VOC family protein [Microbaculum marinum]|uniref:VOC family protein n=1 Tax=Microbaculum marinum TaxID=1764581 RepID=A0AAW9S2B5_9HYPH
MPSQRQDRAVDAPRRFQDRAVIMPCLCYRDARAAIDWLETAFGFETKVAYEGPGGSIAHAELRIGSSYVMLGTQKQDPFNWTTPEQAGVSTQMIYVVVDDADAMFDRVSKLDADIVRPLADTDYGSRDFSVRDPEGHIWNFGTYHPDD